MKRKINLTVIIALVALVGFSSCDKLKDKLFVSFVASTAAVPFTINEITTINTQFDLGLLSQRVNLDSLIKDQTGNAFGLDDIKSINLEEVVITILNPDPANNVANFEQGNLIFATNTSPSPVIVASGLNPDVYAESWNMPVDKTINLADHLKGTQLLYVLSGRARRVTTKKLNCQMVVKFKVN